MAFHSILYQSAADRPGGQVPQEPAFFSDLNLDQIVDAIAAVRPQEGLRDFFLAPLPSVDAVRYRQEIMRDLENPQIRAHVDAFSAGMRSMRERLALSADVHHLPQKQRWFLDATDAYCSAVTEFGSRLSESGLGSRGLAAFRDHLSSYQASDGFVRLRSATEALKGDLSAIEYALLIKDNRITVQQYESEPDYSADVLAAFAIFDIEDDGDETARARTSPRMNRLETRILDLVVGLYPEVFSSLDRYCAGNGDFLDEIIDTFDREVGFYLVTLDYMASFKQAGLAFCYPEVSRDDKAVAARDAFDLALAGRMAGSGVPVVCSDFSLREKERILVVTGPNQGGKTTFARSFGQLHYLARLGCPVPARDARLFLFDGMFTHFEREESVDDLRSKLEDDLVRIHGALEQATADSIVIMNEIFSSTTLEDARFLGEKILDRVFALDALCVYVTFVDELASANDKVASFTADVVREDPAVRTFRIERRPADGLAYALSLAHKHRLTYDDLKERLKR